MEYTIHIPLVHAVEIIAFIRFSGLCGVEGSKGTRRYKPARAERSASVNIFSCECDVSSVDNQ